jgi:hypothetical protein
MANGQGLTPHPLITELAAELFSRGGQNVQTTQEKESAVNAFACERGLPELTTFSGYLGGTVDEPSGKTWRVMYQDQKAVTWLLVPDQEIVYHQRVADHKAAFGRRDVIWVKADAPVRQGRRGESEQSMFLVGSFTNAGDLHASLIVGSTYGGDSGILCAPTPECCGKHTG